MDAFRCGHEKTPENVARNGAPSGRCRTCKNAHQRATSATPEAREAGCLRQAKWRGVEPGRSHGVHNASKNACPQNHPYDEVNTYIFNGTRQCITCRQARTTEYYHRKRTNGGFHTEAEWVALCSEHGNVCAACGMSAPLTRDHIIPVSKGGDNYIENIQPLCRPCNSAKKDRLVPELGAQ